MFKKTALAAVFSLAATVSASAVDLSLFNSDFQTLMNGVARDVAPTLRLGALSGDLQGDATIDHFNFTLIGVGLNTSDGLGRALAPGAAHWDFVLPLSDLVNDNVGSNNFFEHFMVYPALKTAVGFALGTWDFTLSGMYFPQGLTDTALGLAGSAVPDVSPQFSFANVGLQIRKTVLEDSGGLGLVPALSLGAGYHFTSFNLGLTLKSLSDLGFAAPTVGANQTLDMTGDLSIGTSSQVVTADLQLSKHLLIFTPYFKLSGAYQNSTFTGKADMVATVTDTTPGPTTTQNIHSAPEVNVSDFGFLLTSGLELNLFVVTLNVNMVADLSRAFLNVHSFSLNGIDANAISLNTGLRFSF